LFSHFLCGRAAQTAYSDEQRVDQQSSGDGESDENLPGGKDLRVAQSKEGREEVSPQA